MTALDEKVPVFSRVPKETLAVLDPARASTSFDPFRISLLSGPCALQKSSDVE